MSNPPRFVVLQFDDGGRFDYEPPLPHPADIFLEMFSKYEDFSRGVGATLAFEVDPDVIEIDGQSINEVLEEAECTVCPPEPPSFP